MRILYVATKYEYGQPRLGLSFEHTNFFDTLSRMGHSTIYFDFMGIAAERGRRAMNRRLLEVAKSEKVDLMFVCLLADELDQNTVRKITDRGNCTTFNWFCDDHWRFEIFSKYWAPCFHWVSTTVEGAEEWYRQAGYDRAIETQWAVNPCLYVWQHLPAEHNVTFVGQPHGNRRAMIEGLQRSGLSVQAFGNGWPAGRIDFAKMVRIFNTSRINLNFTASSIEAPNAAVRRRRALSNTLVNLPLGYAIKSIAVKAAHQLRRFRGSQKATDSSGAATLLPPQIKGRNFEVPGCGGFMLTQPAHDLERYFTPGKEISLFENMEDCIEKIRYYLAHDEERVTVARAGYERTIREHTYVERFRHLFSRMQLPQSEGTCPGAIDVVS